MLCCSMLLVFNAYTVYIVSISIHARDTMSALFYSLLTPCKVEMKFLTKSRHMKNTGDLFSLWLHLYDLITLPCIFIIPKCVHVSGLCLRLRKSQCKRRNDKWQLINWLFFVWCHRESIMEELRQGKVNQLQPLD